MPNAAAANGPPQPAWGGNPQASQQAYGNQAPITNWDKLEDDLEEELPQTDEVSHLSACAPFQLCLLSLCCAAAEREPQTVGSAAGGLHNPSKPCLASQAMYT